jgi:hypothetical protein
MDVDIELAVVIDDKVTILPLEEALVREICPSHLPFWLYSILNDDVWRIKDNSAILFEARHFAANGQPQGCAILQTRVRPNASIGCAIVVVKEKDETAIVEFRDGRRADGLAHGRSPRL